MSMKLLGDTLDIHGGGLDLQFPHHENELAQTESRTPASRSPATGCTTACLKMGTAKMAGSVGNVVNVADALKHMSRRCAAVLLLSTHYRTPIDLGDWDWKNPATSIPAGMDRGEDGATTRSSGSPSGVSG